MLCSSFSYFELPVWPLKVRVGTNSPSLWPTMSLGHVHRHMLAAVVDGKGVTNEFGEDRGGAAPGLDDLLLAGSVHSFNVLQKSSLDERTFLMLLPIVLNSSLT